MMKMLLVSMFQNVSKLLEKIEPDLRNKSVTYIPTASVVEKLGFFVKIGKWNLRRLGLVVEELDVSTSSYDTIVNTLIKNDIIYIAGGNTFYLLQELRKSGADKILTQEVKKGKLFIGESAGAIVMAPDIGYSAVMDCVEKAPGLKDYVGLGLIDFYVVPHYKNWKMGKAAMKIINAYSDSLELKIISDNQAILVEDNEVRILE
ncbi:putative peptidase Lmo0363 [Oscillospiraceae bacterium]|uniref:Type 1 glutamine amidotransferase-like domain-containing protein n=1 Tax=Allofournierella sp. TaxID=1940256 RepID=UPI0015B0FE56|nr:putative peptidase Lmo0363 [Oscillospiraceae bacterium]